VRHVQEEFFAFAQTIGLLRQFGIFLENPFARAVSILNELSEAQKLNCTHVKERSGPP
jgi:hypothetical protein